MILAFPATWNQLKELEFLKRTEPYSRTFRLAVLRRLI
jgi:hypothetical protein